MVNFDKIVQLRKELKDFLEKHPELKSYQEEIDNRFKKIGTNPKNRAAVIDEIALELNEENKKALKDMGESMKALIEIASSLKNKLTR